MSESKLSTPPSSRFKAILLTVLALDACLTIPFLGRTTLYGVDEGRMAEVAREMAESGDWVVPREGGYLYPWYPPLGYWLLAVSGLIFGFSEFAMRLPSVLAGIALLGLTGNIARRLAGETAGWMTALVLATTPSFVAEQVTARNNMFLTLFAAVAFHEFLAVADGDRRSRRLVVFYLSIALAFLSKGPLGIVLPCLAIAGWLAVYRRWSVLLTLRPWFGAVAVATIALPWYVAVTRYEGWGFLRDQFLLQNVSAFSKGFDQRRPVWFYFVEAPGRLSPWILVFLLSWRVRRTPGLAVAIAWFIALFLFLTASSAKRYSYVTFITPAFAVAMGISIAALCRESLARMRRVLIVFGVGAFVILGVLGIAPIRWRSDAARLGNLTMLLILGGAATSGGVSLLAWKKGPLAAVAGLGTVLGVWQGVFLSVVLPKLDTEGRTQAEFCRRVAARVPPRAPLYTVGPDHTEGFYHFYVGRAMPRRNGEPGYYIASVPQRDRLAASGCTIETLDEVADRRGRKKFLLRLGP